MYDPMVAKLIVWDVDREAATRHMLRALGEYEIAGLKTLIPFHTALLATEQWARGETCRDLVEDRSWLKQLAFPKPERKADGEEDEEAKVQQAYTVEVSGRRFDVTIGPLPSSGLPSGSTTRPSSSSPTGTLRSRPVLRTSSPSAISR